MSQIVKRAVTIGTVLGDIRVISMRLWVLISFFFCYFPFDWAELEMIIDIISIPHSIYHNYYNVYWTLIHALAERGRI